MNKKNFSNRLLKIILSLVVLSFLFTGTYCAVKNKENKEEESNGEGEEVSITYWTAPAAVKIRPGDAPGTSRDIHIKAARNEYESFQVVLSHTEEMIVENISVSSLSAGAGNIDAGNIKVYRECYIDIQTVSNNEGATGLWPDALIPAVDSFFNETRNAFPVTVEANTNQAFWFDVFIPTGTPAGEYEGNVTVNIAGESAFDIPVKLTVWNFTLPSTSTLASAFGFDGWENLLGHFGNRDNDAQEMITPLSMLYTECALMNRISLEGAIGEDWSILPWPATAPIDWSDFDRNWSPFFDGKDLTYGLKGAKLTSQSLVRFGDSDDEEIVYVRNFVSHFKDKGWYDILFDYTWDEPQDREDFDALKERASLVRQADPGIRLLVTTNILQGTNYDITGIVDIWTPVINDMHDKAGGVCWDSEYAGNQRDFYSPLISSGNELYYSTNYAYFGISGDEDPWNNQYYFWGNGDGTLFYPGRPDKIGGTHHIPVESIRLKMIREGMEDYEYMNILKNLGDESFARSRIDTVVTDTYTFSHDPEILYAAREEMAERIQELRALFFRLDS